jgi:hypothetical protein
VAGRLSAKADLVFEGANPDVVMRSLKGQGALQLRDGALRNRNLIKEVFDKLSPVLAVTSSLGGELPPEIYTMLKDRDTPFQSLEVQYAVQGGQVSVNAFRMIHSNYQLAGQGSYGLLDKRVAGSMELALSKVVSGYFVKKIKELEFLAGPGGEIAIPFRISGAAPDISVQPDLSFIGSRILQTGANEFLDRGIQKLSKSLGGKKRKGALVVAAGTASGSSASAQDEMIQQGMDVLSNFLGGKKK